MPFSRCWSSSSTLLVSTAATTLLVILVWTGPMVIEATTTPVTALSKIFNRSAAAAAAAAATVNNSSAVENNDNDNDDENAIYRHLRVPLPTKWRGCWGLNRKSWKWHGKLLPLLHFGDAVAVPDVYVNLRVLWCKALSSFTTPHSPVAAAAYTDDADADNHMAYYMLPPLTRWPLRYLWFLFPRWMHANIELRTAYLNEAIEKELKRLRQMDDTTTTTSKSSTRKLCVIVFGGGYDPRAAKLLLTSKVDRVYELDLPAVVQSKRALLERAIGQERFATSLHDRFVLRAVDLNDDRAVDQTLDEIVAELQQEDKTTTSSSWYTLLVSEALLLYLNPGVAGKILKKASARFGTQHNSGKGVGGASFVFADRLELPKDGENDGGSGTTTNVELKARKCLLDNDWSLQDFHTKPGATRHLGLAHAV